MTSLTQFDLFPLLPFELRIKIWGVALTTPRTVSISCKKGHLDTERRITLSFTSHTPPHPLLRVCHESRFETLNTYSYVPMFKTDVSPRCIYVNFTYDTIRCAAAVLEYLGREEVAGLRKMVLEVGDGAYFGHFHMDTIKRMGQLEELELRTVQAVIKNWGSERVLESLGTDFERERFTDPGWKCPKVRIINTENGELLRTVEGGALVEGWKEGDEYPEHLL
ncbi:hypothetical protein EG329_005083 [Mollisiaceae sp. DMI_Dod_QoI]|nr:hypothetical protein EG329_005083 [Helotiales sp. DMI_Dod_QoI]